LEKRKRRTAAQKESGEGERGHVRGKDGKKRGGNSPSGRRRNGEIGVLKAQCFFSWGPGGKERTQAAS